MLILCTGASGFIGTNLADSLLKQNVNFVNVDIKEPVESNHQLYWKQCDILHLEELTKIFNGCQPTHVVHLAAKTDDTAKTLDDYRANIEGTANVLEAIKTTPSISRVIITSTQFVVQPGYFPKHNEDFSPHTLYGQSKVIAEQLTRSANLDCTWTIIRPTNIWGPWHPRYPYEFWHVLKKGRYFHPGKKPVIRSFGYVGNVVYQIERILQAPTSLVNRKVYYVGDMPINLIEWVNGFSRAIAEKDVRIVPRSVVRCMALAGDFLSFFGVRFPIHSSRYRSMTTDYPAPMGPTLDHFGESPFSMDEGIKETTAWLRHQGLI